jgi:ADP-heptose:LPS heptosyltransferase
MKILIFKVNQLGDNVVFKPVVDYLASQQCGHEIYLLTSPTASALYEGQIPAERLFAFPTAKFISAWKDPLFLTQLVALVRKIQPDICLLSEDQGNVAHFLSWVSGAEHRIGSFRPFLKWRWGLTVDVQPPPGTNIAAWEWALLQALLRATSGEPSPSTPPPPDLTPLVRSMPVLDFVIHAGGSQDYKRWLLERFVELTNRLSVDYRVGWVASGTELPVDLCEAVELVVTPSLADLVTVLATTRVFVGNNSGPMNIAQALGTPSVIICGPSSRIWDPFWHSDRMVLLRDESLPCLPCDPPHGGPINRCTNILHPMACMKSWSVEEVEKRCRQLLEARAIIK